MAQKQYPIINNFSRGELSSRMEGRVDIQGYYNGCKQMENCIMVAQGGAEKRPGTIYLGDAYNPGLGITGTARLIPLEVSDSEKYIIEMGHQYLRIWDVLTKLLVQDPNKKLLTYDGGTGATPVVGEVITGTTSTAYGTIESVTAGSDGVSGSFVLATVTNSPFQDDEAITGDTAFVAVVNGIETEIDLKLETEYSFDEVADIQYAQTEGVIFFAHENHLTMKLELRDTGFAYIALGFKTDAYDPLLEYTRGDVVSNLGVYYISKKTQTGHLPESGNWEEVGTVPINASGDIIYYNDATAYNVYDLVVYDENIWKCKIAGTDKTPGLSINAQVEDWNNNGSITASGASWSGMGRLLDTIYGAGGWRELKKQEFFLFAIWTYKYRKYISEPTQYWIQVAALPNIISPQTVYSDATTPIGPASPYSINDYVYNSTSFKLFRSLAEPNSTDLANDRNWDILDGNPLFNEIGDYPAAIAFMGDRLYLAGTKNKPQTISASRIGDHNNFAMGTDDDDAFNFTIAADRSSRIKWLVAKDVLMIGTSSSEWLALGGGVGITPTTVQVLRQSAYGSAYQQAVFVADSLLFFQKGGRKLREYIYSNDNKAYLANDLTFFADHITESGIVESTYQQNPDSILWSIRKDGALIGLTYDRLNQIAGWHKHTTDGLFLSTTSIEGAGDEDELWLIASRNVDGAIVKQIEYMNKRSILNQEEGVFVDSAKVHTEGEAFIIENVTWSALKNIVTYSGTADFVTDDYVKISGTGIDSVDKRVYQVHALNTGTKTFELYKEDGTAYHTTDEFIDPESGTILKVTNTVSGLDHLEAATVSILGDGAVFPNQVVASGTITISSRCNIITIGRPYTMKLSPMSIEIPGSSTIASNRRISKVTLKLYKTLGGWIGPNEVNMQELRFRSTYIAFGTPPSLFTGTIDIPIDSSSEKESSIIIFHNQPLPMTVLAIISDITYSRS